MAAPGLFVILWSTGFIGAKFGLPYSEPLTFLLWRFGFVTLLFLALTLSTRAPWPADLGQAGHIVVSGLARGIDSAAHEGSLQTGTAAVLGGGVDDIYPPENAGLYDRIVQHGCVVSESEPGRTAVARVASASASRPSCR